MALFYPILLALSLIAANITGHGFSALGFLPALLALTLYSMLPVVRNIVTGIVNLDTALIEAAHGVGMTVRQRLLRVALPVRSEEHTSELQSLMRISYTVFCLE